MFGHKGTMLSSVIDSKSNTLAPSKTRTLNNSKLMRFEDLNYQREKVQTPVIESLKKLKKYDEAARQVVQDKPYIAATEFSTLEGDLNRLYKPRDSSGKPRMRTAQKSVQPDQFSGFDKQRYQD